MIELAVSAAVMVTCIAGTFQFGYTFYVYNQLVTAVGNGGRYAAVCTYTAQDVDKRNQSIRNMVVYGDPQPAPDARPVVNGLTPDLVDVNWTVESGAPSAVSIAIHFTSTLFRIFCDRSWGGGVGAAIPKASTVV